MKNLQTRNDLLSFQDFVLEKNINDILAMVEGEISELEASQELNEEEMQPLNEAFLMIAMALSTLAFITLRTTIKFFKKRKKIRRMLDRSDLPAEERDKLKKELKSLKYDEAKTKDKMQKKKEQLDAKAAKAKAAATPEEKAKAKKAKEKADKKYAKAKAEFDVERTTFRGSN